MSLQACANIVAKGDPLRFRAAMAAPVEARRVLFPLYAFNVEVSRAPWVTKEPMIAEMRLQWWRDVLEEISKGGSVRRHEVVDAMVPVVDSKGAQALDLLVQARRWDVYADPFEDEDHFWQYVDRTGGLLMWVCARALGASQETLVRRHGAASGMARLLSAAPALIEAGKHPLPSTNSDAISSYTSRALDMMASKKDLRTLPKGARPALISSWQALPLLRKARKNGAGVLKDGLKISTFQDHSRLLLASLR